MILKGKALEDAARVHYEAVDRRLRRYDQYEQLPSKAKKIWRDIALRWARSGEKLAADIGKHETQLFRATKETV